MKVGLPHDTTPAMPGGAGRTGRRQLLLFVALVALVALTRAPFFSMTLAGEEGSNGRGIVMLAQGHLPRSVIARSAHGGEFFIPAGHNLGGYLLPAALAAPVLRWTGFVTLPERVRAAHGLRACYALIYSLVLLLALVIVEPARRPRAALLLAAFALPTLPLIASVQVNYDGAVSPLLVVATLLLFQRAVAQGGIAWACAAGALLSFGKLEFVAAVAAALFVSEVVARRWRLWPAFAASLVLGIFFWRWLDPENFNYGYDVIGRFWTMQGGAHAPLLPRAWAYGRTHLGLFWPLYASVVIALAYAALRRRSIAALLPVGLSLAFILAGYHAIAWRGDNFPRYFAPCFPLAAILIAELEAPPMLSIVVAAAVATLSLPAYWRGYLNRERALASLIGAVRDDRALAAELESNPRGCITVTDMDSGVGFYSRTASFSCCFAQWTDWHAKQGERLCP